MKVDPDEHVLGFQTVPEPKTDLVTFNNTESINDNKMLKGSIEVANWTISSSKSDGVRRDEMITNTIGDTFGRDSNS